MKLNLEDQWALSKITIKLRILWRSGLLNHTETDSLAQ